MTMMQDAMKKGCTEEPDFSLFTNIHPNMHDNAQGQCLKLQKTFNKTFNIVCHQHHPPSLPSMLNESQ